MKGVFSAIRTFLEWIIRKFLLLFKLEPAVVAVVHIDWHLIMASLLKKIVLWFVTGKDYMPIICIFGKKDINLCTIKLTKSKPNIWRVHGKRTHHSGPAGFQAYL